MSRAAGPIFPAYLNGPSSCKENEFPTCSQSVWSDRTAVPFGQRDDNDSVNSMFVLAFLLVLVVGGITLLEADMTSPVHWQTDGMLLGFFDRTRSSFVTHMYSLSSGLNL